MNLTINKLPKNWHYNSGAHWYAWMHKIKSNYYSDANEMDKAYLKFETR